MKTRLQLLDMIERLLLEIVHDTCSSAPNGGIPAVANKAESGLFLVGKVREILKGGNGDQ